MTFSLSVWKLGKMKNSTLIDIVNRCNLSKMFLRLTCELREPLLAILKSPSQSDA